ncbi:hypothetical protein AYO20_06069 [Fonsecaea nubica]|uniref:SCP domain-containing protein n=1 Tax=Fonsecaea nubica TaxID=856822 RepID=A0A178CZD4_9EURO|nr:hypothetical protein AYO20_06069 [Fonsecaea nubica]OAL34652.1 hypothetical protein AYO20_06069 [Fonsecaea nubica]
MSNISTMASPLSEHEHEHAMVQGPPLEKRAVPPPPTDATFKNTVLARVNAYRALHSAPAVTWDNALAQAAKTAATSTVPNFTLWLKKGLDWWYGEVRDYYSWAADHSGQYHFTQLVWKATTKIGCSWSANQCATAHGDYYLVCEFQPKGNIAGQFGGNVLDA